MVMKPEEIIKNVRELISLPEVVIRAGQLLESPSASVAEIGEVISHDPALCARLLKLVNSAFYNFPNKIETIPHAISMIGLHELRLLVFAATATSTFQNISPDSFDMNAFWQRSVYCALIAKKLSEVMSEEHAGSMFLAGLLHDIGRLIVFSCLEQQAQQIVVQAEGDQRSMSEIEHAVLGFSSPELGACLLQSWDLPRSLWEPVRYQLVPEQAGKFEQEARLLKLARQITDCVEPELKRTQALQAEHMPKVEIDDLKMSEEELELLMAEASIECFDVLAIVNPDAAIIY